MFNHVAGLISVLFVAAVVVTAGSVFDSEDAPALPPCFFECKGVAGSPSDALDQSWRMLFTTMFNSNVRELHDTFMISQTRINEHRTDSIRNTISTTGKYILEDGRWLKLLVNRALKKESHTYRHLLIACIEDDECGCRITYPSNTAATLCSIVLPGCGQIYKKRTSRGVAFLCSFLTSVAASGICYLASDRMYDNAINARTQQVRQQYASRRNGLLFTSGGAAIAGLAIYCLNIYDAYTVAGVPSFR